jgi:4-hydroxy-tetrahydrodipicolinate reductase
MKKIPIMINGLPGNVARIMAAAGMKDDRFIVMPYSLTGADISDTTTQVDNQNFSLLKPDTRDEIVKELFAQYPSFIAVDYTHPSAVNGNAIFYTQHKIPFVMGTTGGDREKLEETVQKGNSPAVIAPNMAKQIVGLQAMMDYAAKTVPGLFTGYSLEVKESHQQGKADTSGTAKAMVGYFNELGADFKMEEIQQIRDPKVQENQWLIPKEHLSGHGWHTYTLTAADGSSLFEIKHNINGRDIYVSGTFDAVVYLSKKMQLKENTKQLFTMIDVLNQN